MTEPILKRPKTFTIKTKNEKPEKTAKDKKQIKLKKEKSVEKTKKKKLMNPI